MALAIAKIHTGHKANCSLLALLPIKLSTFYDQSKHFLDSTVDQNSITSFQYESRFCGIFCSLKMHAILFCSRRVFLWNISTEFGEFRFAIFMFDNQISRMIPHKCFVPLARIDLRLSWIEFIRNLEHFDPGFNSVSRRMLVKKLSIYLVRRPKFNSLSVWFHGTAVERGQRSKKLGAIQATLCHTVALIFIEIFQSWHHGNISVQRHVLFRPQQIWKRTCKALPFCKTGYHCYPSQTVLN